MTESESVEGHAFRADRTYDEVVLRFPSLNRLVRAFLPAEAVKHLYAAQREQLLAVRSVVDTMISNVEVAEREDGAGAPRRTQINVDSLLHSPSATDARWLRLRLRRGAVRRTPGSLVPRSSPADANARAPCRCTVLPTVAGHM